MSTTDTVYERRWWTLAVLSLALMVISLDNTILNVALPTLVRELHATASQLQWIVDSYVLVFAGLLLTAGSVGDKFGRKRALSVGLAAFGGFSMLAGLSGSANQLITARALMGIGGALIMPATLSILTNVFPPAERARAIAIWSGVTGLSIPLGPVVGGWLLEHASWGAVFFVNVPVIAIALVAGFFLVPESRDPKSAPLDPLGAGLSIAGLTALLYGIIEAPSKGWTSDLILGAFGLAALLLALFALWERRAAYPMLDMGLFKNARFTASSLSVTLVFFALFGTTFFLSQYLQSVLGYSTLESGVRVIPVAFGVMVSAPLSARLTERFGAKAIVAIGLGVVAGALGLLSTATTSSGYPLVAITEVLLGFGMGMAMTPATDSIMGAVPKENAGVGSAVNDTTRQVGGALGVAVLGSLLSTSYRSDMAGAVLGLPAPAAQAARDSVGAALEVAQQVGGRPGALLAEAARAAFISGMDGAVVVGAGVAVVGALIALLFLPSWPAEAEAEAAVVALEFDAETREEALSA